MYQWCCCSGIMSYYSGCISAFTLQTYAHSTIKSISMNVNYWESELGIQIERTRERKSKQYMNFQCCCCCCCQCCCYCCCCWLKSIQTRNISISQEQQRTQQQKQTADTSHNHSNADNMFVKIFVNVNVDCVCMCVCVLSTVFTYDVIDHKSVSQPIRLNPIQSDPIRPITEKLFSNSNWAIAPDFLFRSVVHCTLSRSPRYYFYSSYQTSIVLNACMRLVNTRRCRCCCGFRFFCFVIVFYSSVDFFPLCEYSRANPLQSTILAHRIERKIAPIDIWK